MLKAERRLRIKTLPKIKNRYAFCCITVLLLLQGTTCPVIREGLPTHKTRPIPLRQGTSYMLGLTEAFIYLLMGKSHIPLRE